MHTLGTFRYWFWVVLPHPVYVTPPTLCATCIHLQSTNKVLSHQKDSHLPPAHNARWPTLSPQPLLGTVYTTVEKSTYHEKRAFLNCDWSKKQLLTGGCSTRWRKQWWWTFLMDDKLTWLPTWRHFLELGFSGGGVSCLASRGWTRNYSSGEAQLNKKYFLAFNSSPAHPPFASYNHVLAKHSWSTGGLLHRSVNRPLGGKKRCSR